MGGRGSKRMANRMLKRTGLEGEGIAVAFGFKSLWAALWLGALEEAGPLGEIASLFMFHFHRIVLATETHTYVFKAKPFHRPGELIGTYPHGPGTVQRKRGKLTFPDGQVVWHSPFFAFRMKRIQAAANGG